MIWPSVLVFTFTTIGLSFVVNDPSWFTQIGCAMLGVVAALFWTRLPNQERSSDGAAGE